MSDAFCEKTIFESWETGGYRMYRIPGMIVTQKGTVLAYYEARMANGDWGKENIIMRRSEDNGLTWSDRIMLIEQPQESTDTYHNVVLFPDRNGDIHMLWHRNYCQCFYQKSVDDGVTWSEPREITEVYERFRKEYDWNVIAAGPGHGIQLANGRLFVPVWISIGGKRHRPSVLSCIYSDDHGDSWERGEIIWDKDGFVNPNETGAIQLDNGSVLMNIRHESDDTHRAVSVSKDGATGWSKPVLDPVLADPVCFAGIVKGIYPGSGKSFVLFSNCNFDGSYQYDPETGKRFHKDDRIHLTIRISEDDCQSWKYSRELEAVSGYSDVAVSKDGSTFFCLYEKDWENGSWGCTRHMAVARFNLEWVRENS